MNERNSEESIENWLVNFSSKNLTKKKQSTIINCADKITTQEQKKYDTLLARAIYASASPFSKVENSHRKTCLTRFDRLTLCQAGTRYQSLCLTLNMIKLKSKQWQQLLHLIK